MTTGSDTECFLHFCVPARLDVCPPGKRVLRRKDFSCSDQLLLLLMKTRKTLPEDDIAADLCLRGLPAALTVTYLVTADDAGNALCRWERRSGR